MISPEDSFNQKPLSLSQRSQQVINLAAESSSDEYELLKIGKPTSTFGAPGNRQARTADISKHVKHQNSREDVNPTANLDDEFLNSTGEETLGNNPKTVSPDVAKVSNDPRTNLKQEEADAQSTVDPVSTRGKNSNESAEKADDISVICLLYSSSEEEDNDYPGNLQAQNIVTQTQTSIKRDAEPFWDSEEEDSDDEVNNSNDSAAKEIATRHAHDTRKQSSSEEDSVPPPPPAKPSTDDEDSDATMEVQIERDDEEEGEQTDALQETERAMIAATEAGRRQQGRAQRKRKISIDTRELLRQARERIKNCPDTYSDVSMDDADDGKEVVVVGEIEETSEAMNSHRAPGQKPVRVAGNQYATRDSASMQPVLSRRAKQGVKRYEEESDYTDTNYLHSLEQQDRVMNQTSVQQTSKAPVKKERWTKMKKQKYMKEFACTDRYGVQMKRGHTNRCLTCRCCFKCIVPPWCPNKDSHSCKQRTKTDASLAMSPIQEGDGNFVKDDSNGEGGAKIGPAAKQTTKPSMRSPRTKSGEKYSDDEVNNSNDRTAKEIAARHAHDTRKQSSSEEDSVPPPPPATPSTDDEDSDATMEVEKERDDEEEQTDELQETERVLSRRAKITLSSNLTGRTERLKREWGKDNSKDLLKKVTFPEMQRLLQEDPYKGWNAQKRRSVKDKLKRRLYPSDVRTYLQEKERPQNNNNHQHSLEQQDTITDQTSVQRTKTNASLAMSPIKERDGHFLKDDSNGEAGTKSRTPAKRKSTGAASNSRKKKRQSPPKAAPSEQTSGQRCNLEDSEAERAPSEIMLAAQPLPKQEDAGVGNALSPWIKSPAPGGRRSSAPDPPGAYTENPSHSNPSQTSHEDRINTNAVTGRMAHGSHLAHQFRAALANNILLDVQGVGIRQPEPTPTTQPTTTAVATPLSERWSTPNNSEHPEPATNAHVTVIGSIQAVQTLRLEPTPSKTPSKPPLPSTALVAPPSTSTTVHADNMDTRRMLETSQRSITLFQKDKDDYQWSTARDMPQICLHVLAAIGLAAIVFLSRFVVVEWNIRP